MLVLFIAAVVVCLLSAGIIIVLHFQMKFRLEAAGLPVKWFMMLVFMARCAESRHVELIPSDNVR
jgi:hypothetical protein